MVNLVNETQFKIPLNLIEKCVTQTLEEKKSKDSLTVLFVSVRKIRELNSVYYKKDKTTDVLSFNSEEDGYLGEVIICPAYIKACLPKPRPACALHADRRRQENSKDFQWELCHVAIHGTLHLLDIHHEDSEGSKRLHYFEKSIIDKVINK